jgi:formylglycine-generating enzyme required for sulfatase activity
VRVVWERGIPAEVDEAPPEPEAPRAPRPPHPVREPLIEMVELPGGTFWMGSDPAQDPLSGADERPRRQVRLGPFSMGGTPVTRGLYRLVRSTSPERWEASKDDDALPANWLSWEDAVRFCNTLSERSGLRPSYRNTDAGWTCDWDSDGYRLPTEAEWEYACRAGTDTPRFSGWDMKEAERFAWLFGNSGYREHAVGEKAPNPWGLYDMFGNVWEWCWDWYADAYDPKDLDNPKGPNVGEMRILRGDSFKGVRVVLRFAGRFVGEPELRSDDVGFRCVRGSGRQLGH